MSKWSRRPKRINRFNHKLSLALRKRHPWAFDRRDPDNGARVMRQLHDMMTTIPAFILDPEGLKGTA